MTDTTPDSGTEIAHTFREMGEPIICFNSGGNDSIALVEWFRRNGYKNVTAVYNNTGWAAPNWHLRMAIVEQWVQEIGFKFVELESEGMEALVRRKSGWPMPKKGAQFCTQFLKINPAIEWLEAADPEKEFVCSAGIRREESGNRSEHPEWIEESSNHGGRSFFCPLVRHTEAQRNELVATTPLPVLPHRSQECSPCIYANKDDIKLVGEEKIALIEVIETDLGYTQKGKPKVMFRPYRQMGAVGIRESVRWANTRRGTYSVGSGCQLGFCGL